MIWLPRPHDVDDILGWPSSATTVIVTTPFAFGRGVNVSVRVAPVPLTTGSGTIARLLVVATSVTVCVVCSFAAVAQEFVTGRTYAEIACRLGVAAKTVRNQLQSIYAKLGVKNKVALLKRLDQ